MKHLIVGVGEVSVRLRFARSLKDKRQILSSIIKKLKNDGFSVVEADHQEEAQLGTIGFTYAGRDAGHVEQVIKKALDLFRMECEVLEKNHEVFDYGSDEVNFDWNEEEGGNG